MIRRISVMIAVLLFVLSTGAAFSFDCREALFEVFSEGFSFPEGPAFDSDGNLYVVNFKNIGDIARITPEGETSVLVNLQPIGSEANGMAYFAPENCIIACDDEARRIIRVDLPGGKVTPVVEKFLGESFHHPNDICLLENGDFFFTDPYRVDETTGGRVFFYSNEEKKLYLLLDGLAFPNGLTVSPDRSTLYVAQTVRRNVTAYPLNYGGRHAGPGHELFLMSGGGGPDGIEADTQGNIYIAHYGGGAVNKVSPAGELISCVRGFGPNVTNVQIKGDFIYVTEAKFGQVLKISLQEFK